ncbi:MAG: CapA family protein, partial [Chloroflexi bacterium]|nr:CapA family protein [Chloroflexota bacterium]
MAGEEITLAIVGDVNFDREDPASLLAHCASHLREADIAFGNLEGVYSDRGTPITGKIEVGSAHLRCHPRNFQGFIDGGFDAVALANNHSMDFGGEALLQTVGMLDKAGIAHCGGGRNLAEAHAPCFLERKGTRFAFLSYTSVFIPGFSAGKDSPGCATVRVMTSYEPPANLVYQPGFPPIIHTYGDPVDVEMMVEDVRAAKAHADIVIVAWHWGIS